MYCLSGMEEEKRFLRGLFFVLLQKLNAFLQKDHVCFLKVKAGSNHTGSVIAGIGVLGQRFAIDDPSGRHGNLVAIYVCI